MIIQISYRYNDEQEHDNVPRTIQLDEPLHTAEAIVDRILDVLACGGDRGTPCPFTAKELHGPFREKLMAYVTAKRHTLSTGEPARNTPLEYVALERPRRDARPPRPESTPSPQQARRNKPITPKR